jgi:predicted oxidoreductase (fatty acid repression mutant protein)
MFVSVIASTVKETEVVTGLKDTWALYSDNSTVVCKSQTETEKVLKVFTAFIA